MGERDSEPRKLLVMSRGLDPPSSVRILPVVEPTETHSPAQLSRIASELYTEGPTLLRRMQVYRPFICPFDRLIPWVPVGASVLDVGCGGGLFLGLLARSGRRIRGVGFDVSGDAIAIAGRMAGRIDPTQGSVLSFVRQDVDVDWPAGPFDVVSVVDVMHHVPPDRQRDLLVTAAHHVRPGGTLIYKDMCRRPAWRAAANRAHDLLLARQWIHYRPIEDIDRWANELSFTPTHQERINLLWYGHELRVFTKPQTGD